MKILTACVLGCAMMVLARAAAIQDANDKNNQTVSTFLVKKSMFCSGGWFEINGRHFYYVSNAMTWAEAERHCQSMAAHLASVRNLQDNAAIQALILTITNESKQAWIGALNAQQKDVWLWSDGSRFAYAKWCKGEPNNLNAKQYCLQINHNGEKCWDDVECDHKLPFVCAKKA